MLVFYPDEFDRYKSLYYCGTEDDRTRRVSYPLPLHLVGESAATASQSMNVSAVGRALNASPLSTTVPKVDSAVSFAAPLEPASKPFVPMPSVPPPVDRTLEIRMLKLEEERDAAIAELRHYKSTATREIAALQREMEALSNAEPPSRRLQREARSVDDYL